MAVDEGDETFPVNNGWTHYVRLSAWERIELVWREGVGRVDLQIYGTWAAGLPYAEFKQLLADFEKRIEETPSYESKITREGPQRG